MASVFKMMTFFRGDLSAHRTTVYTVPPGKRAVITEVLFSQKQRGAFYLHFNGISFEITEMHRDIDDAPDSIFHVHQVLESGQTLSVEYDSYGHGCRDWHPVGGSIHVAGVEETP